MAVSCVEAPYRSACDLLSAATASAAMLFASAAQAMDIAQFDKMADDDQDEYKGDLVVGAIRVLREPGQHGRAKRLGHLFVNIEPGDKLSVWG